MTYILSFSVCRERMLEVYFQVVCLFVLHKALQALMSTRECCWLHTTTELLQGVKGLRFLVCPGSRRVLFSQRRNRIVPRLNHDREEQFVDTSTGVFISLVHNKEKRIS